MARIINSEYPEATAGNIEKINGDFFKKVIVADGDGNFISPFAPAEYDEIAITYVAAGNGLGQIETVLYKLATVTQATLTLTYDSNDNLVGVAKA